MSSMGEEKKNIHNELNKTSPEYLKSHRAEFALNAAKANAVSIIMATIIPFVVRTFMARILGGEILGLNSFFYSTIQVLNMTELGIGAVMDFFLYKPAAEGDVEKIGAYLSFLKKIYYVIAAVIFTGGMIILPFLDRLISGNIPEGQNIYLLFFLYLVSTVLLYIFLPESTTLFSAYQRSDLNSIITSIGQAFLYCIQIIAIIVIKSYFIYVLALLLQAFLYLFLRYYFSKKYFPFVKIRGKLSGEEKADIKKHVIAMVGHQMDEKLLGSFDNIVVSALMGLTAVAIYGNYFYVVTAVTMLMMIVYNAVLSGIGNAIATETTDSNYYRFKCMTMLSSFLAGLTTACMLSMYQTFMTLWMPGMLMPMSFVVLMCVYNYSVQIRKTVQTFKNAAGMWREDFAKPYISMAVDIVLDIILINFFGMYGAIISSIFCVIIIEFPWESVVLMKKGFNKRPADFFLSILKYTLINALLIFICFFASEKLISLIWKNGVSGMMNLAAFMIEFVFSVLIFSCAFFIIYHKTKEFRTWSETIKALVRKK